MSINTDGLDEAALSAAEAVAAAARRDPLAVLGHALDAALALAPVDDLKPHLDAAAARRAIIAKRAADLAKFGRTE